MATWVNLMDILYPVGSMYFSTSSTSPSSLIGGSWVQITDAAIRGAVSTGYTGADTHKLTTDEMPSHSHEIWTNEGTIERAVYHISKAGTKNMNAANRSTDIKNASYLIAKAVGGGKHIQLCNAPTTVSSGTERPNIWEAGDVVWLQH